MRIPLNLLLRDITIVVVAVGALTISHSLEGSGAIAHWPVAILAGVLLAVSGYLVHEWGHLLGALASRSVVHLPESVSAVFLFKFDTGLNSSRQFLWMSIGGFIASAIVIALYVAILSLDLLADRIALGLTVLGVLATFVLEVPPAWRVYRGAALPSGVAFVESRDRLR